MQLTSWGKYPIVDSEIIRPASATGVLEIIKNATSTSMIARGLGRSYGDSSLADHVISTEYLDHFQYFDQETGILTCSAGATLADILCTFVPKGWFLSVTPGTKFVTVGGAIASDVHGKNHHLDGTFADHVQALTLATVSDGIVKCSRSLFPELFYATCGGMGLTGVILSATLKLKAIVGTNICETTIKAQNLEELFDHIDANNDAPYSVAWVDCLTSGRSLGRSLLMIGEHTDTGDLVGGNSSKLGIPVEMPSFVLNRYSIAAFNAMYYHRLTNNRSQRRLHYEPFFYPLDGINNWNRLYGRRGFTQYQFVLPSQSGLAGMTTILKYIAKSKRASFLAVLKSFGERNGNHISFPREGYTLALDFKLSKVVFELLDELDTVVLDYGGSIYLTKDVRMSRSTFRACYPRWEEFVQVRKKYGADRVFNSLQSQRLGL